MKTKTAPLGICDLCGDSIPRHRWHTSKRTPRLFCGRDCRNTANSRAGATSARTRSTHVIGNDTASAGMGPTMKPTYKITRRHTDDSHETLHFTTDNLKTAQQELSRVAYKMQRDGLRVVLTYTDATGQYPDATNGTRGIWYRINKVN